MEKKEHRPPSYPNEVHPVVSSQAKAQSLTDLALWLPTGSDSEPPESVPQLKPVRPLTTPPTLLRRVATAVQSLSSDPEPVAGAVAEALGAESSTDVGLEPEVTLVEKVLGVAACGVEEVAPEGAGAFVVVLGDVVAAAAAVVVVPAFAVVVVPAFAVVVVPAFAVVVVPAFAVVVAAFAVVVAAFAVVVVAAFAVPVVVTFAVGLAAAAVVAAPAMHPFS